MNVMNIPASLVDAIELLTRKWNPPHRPPRPIRLSPTDPALALPANVPLASLRGAYLRGMAIDRVAAERDCHWSDLRGTVFGDGPAQIKDARFTLRARIRGRPSVALLPQLRAWLMAGGHAGRVRAVACSRDGMRLATAGDDGTVRLWLRDTDGTAQQTARLDPACGPIGCIAFKRDGTQLACGGSDGTIHRWALATDGSAHALGAFAAHAVVSGSSVTVTGMAFLSAEDDTLASVGADGALRLWRFDAAGTAAKPFFESPDPAGVNAMSCSRDGARIASSGERGLVVVWGLTADATEKRFVLRADERSVNSLSISDDGSTLAAGGNDGVLTLWAIGTTSAQELGRAVATGAGIDSVALGVNSRLVACSDAGGEVQLWRFGEGRTLERCATLAGHSGTVHQLAFNRDETQLASAGADGTVRLWALLPNGTGRETACLKARLLETRIGAEDATPPPSPDAAAEARLVRVGDADADTAYTFERSDGRAFDTELLGAETVCADRLLHEGLCFCDPAMGCVPVFEVPPAWLQWSADRRRVVVPRAVHSREELRDWADAGPA